MKELSVNHLLGIKYINKNDIDLIFETADHFKEVINRPIKKVPSLRDITISNIFFENSTRTKLSLIIEIGAIGFMNPVIDGIENIISVADKLF